MNADELRALDALHLHRGSAADKLRWFAVRPGRTGLCGTDRCVIRKPSYRWCITYKATDARPFVYDGQLRKLVAGPFENRDAAAAYIEALPRT